MPTINIPKYVYREIVRCKYCKYWHTKECARLCNADDFCSHGKKKELPRLSETQIEVCAALAENNLNVSQTAKALYMHRNNVEYHLDRVKEMTGLDPHYFWDLVTLLEGVRSGEVKVRE